MIEVTIKSNGDITIKGHSFTSQEPCARICGYIDCFKMIGKDISQIRQSYGSTDIVFPIKGDEGVEYVKTLFTEGLYQLAGLYKHSIKVYDKRERSR